MYVYDNISLSSCKNKKCLRQNLWRQQSWITPFLRKSCRFLDNVEKYGRAVQVTDVSIILRMCIGIFVELLGIREESVKLYVWGMKPLA